MTNRKTFEDVINETHYKRSMRGFLLFLLGSGLGFVGGIEYALRLIK